MERPLLNEDQREQIRLNTLQGVLLALHLAIMGVKREAWRTGGYFHMRRTMKNVVKLVNARLLNID